MQCRNNRKSIFQVSLRDTSPIHISLLDPPILILTPFNLFPTFSIIHLLSSSFRFCLRCSLLKSRMIPFPSKVRPKPFLGSHNLCNRISISAGPSDCLGIGFSPALLLSNLVGRSGYSYFPARTSLMSSMRY